ncbi:GNAT family N-acetyltransferase [Methanolobus mangrovi]|uniref:GNAT family N-acetyltransferase n=1 Tax=Methanolobus mangrovi TaxID=3072977 RepID=A0AA51UFB6_9EURY|nr:GNAT family N-acetyltransferase [Methanolobus mangrovi]WMW22184.1 GNAT family N-acetyltransferase [Methanolobus mangrovi]
MNPEVTIRRAELEDEVHIEVLMSTYFLDIEGIAVEDFVIATIDDKVIGAACLMVEKIPEVHSIAVHPNYRGKGIGRMLLDYLITDIEGQEFLFTRTTSPSFFEKLGFIKLEDSEKKELWEDCAGCNRFNNCKQSVLRLEIKKR